MASRSRSTSSAAASASPAALFAARQAARAKLDRSAAALRDRTCAGKPGELHEYRLAVAARCVPVAGRALQAAEERRRARAAAAAAGRRDAAAQVSAPRSGRASSRGSAAAPRRSARDAAVQVSAARQGSAAARAQQATREEIAYLKRRQRAMGEPDGAIDARDVTMCVLIARAMSIPSRRQEFPDVMRRFERVTELANVRGAEAHLGLIFQVLEELLEAELRTRDDYTGRHAKKNT